MTLAPGSRLGHYEILAPLGVGGMGIVFRARDPRLRREVALKVLPPELADDGDRLARFEREARAASALNHPNIITIYEIGEAEGVTYIAMELVDGETLRQLLAAGPLEPARITELGAQIADGLAKAHAAGIVHRDLKPENVMVTRDGFVKILDFGIARRTPLAGRDGTETSSARTEPGTVVGTPGYMSPEQATGKPVDFRSDQFSFGAILYEMVTGSVAFDRPSPVEVLVAIVKEDPDDAADVNPSVPEHIAAVIARCLKKKPEERFADTREIARGLRGTAGALPAPRVTPPRPSEPVRPHRTLRRAAITVAAALALIAGGVILRNVRGTQIESLAVLPFDTPSSDPDAEYLGHGLADDLIDDLSRLPNLRVIARSSVSKYKGQAADASAIGKQLRVQAVLAGTMVPRGDRIEVAAELVDARRNAHIWGRKYDRGSSEILQVQKEISRDVAEALRPQSAPPKDPAPDPGSTTNSEAYRSYLKGRYHWGKRTEPDVRRAVSYFQEAIDADPAYADAYSGLADANIALGFYEFLPPNDAYPRAKAAGEKSVAIDDTAPEGHASLGGIALWYGWDWSTSRRELERALALNPNYAMGRHWLADLLTVEGRHDEAIVQSRKALELDPLSLIISSWLGRRYYLARRYEDAERESRKTLELDPNFVPGHWTLGSVLLARGKTKESIAEFETAVRLSGDNPRYLSYLGNALARSGDSAGARAVLKRLDAIEGSGRYVSSLDRALVQAGLGENERAMDSIEKGFDDRPSLMPYLAVDPLWDGLRGNSRFPAVLEKLQLPQVVRTPPPSR